MGDDVTTHYAFHQHTNTHIESQRTNTLQNRIFELLDSEQLQQTSIDLNTALSESEDDEVKNVYSPIKLTKLPSQNDVMGDIAKLQQLKHRFHHRMTSSKSRRNDSVCSDDDEDVTLNIGKSVILSLDEPSPSDYEHSRNETTVCISYHDLQTNEYEKEEEEGKEDEIECRPTHKSKHGSSRSLSRFKIPSLFKNGSFSTKSQIKEKKNSKMAMSESGRKRRSRSMTDLGDDGDKDGVDGDLDAEEQGDIVSLLSVLVQHGLYSKKNLNSVQQLTCFNNVNQ